MQSHRTVVLSQIDAYHNEAFLFPEERDAEEAERSQRLMRFPHAVMLLVSYPELDFANRWCWQTFGPGDGPCLQRYSEYPACDRADDHGHDGVWTYHWFIKTDYDYGYCEWYFARAEDAEQFLANLDNIHWGEKYPK